LIIFTNALKKIDVLLLTRELVPNGLKKARSLLSINHFSNGLEILVFGRLEKVNLSNKYSKLKILGTLLCVLGAFTMSIMQSISAPTTEKEAPLPSSSTPSDTLFDVQKIIGCLYLMISVLILSSSVVLQVTIVIK
jgi:hypothetical protein